MNKVYMIVFILGVVLGAMAHAAGFDDKDPNMALTSGTQAGVVGIGLRCPEGTCDRNATNRFMLSNSTGNPKGAFSGGNNGNTAQ